MVNVLSAKRTDGLVVARPHCLGIRAGDQINTVRHPIGDDGERRSLIRTLARKGFSFVGEVKGQRDRKCSPRGRLQDLAADR